MKVTIGDPVRELKAVLATHLHPDRVSGAVSSGPVHNLAELAINFGGANLAELAINFGGAAQLAFAWYHRTGEQFMTETGRSP